jgi:tetratricopeptide (TPR) repeat protein
VADAITELVSRAAALRDAGKAAEALPIFRMAAELEPDCAEYCYQLGRTCLDLDQCDEAALALARAVDLFPAHWAARYWLGVTYFRLQEWEEALEHLTFITGREPLFPGGHFYFGVVCEELGRLDDAQAAYERVIALDPTDARTHFFLGCLTAGRSQMARARTELDILETLDADLAHELDECLSFCDALDKLGPSATINFLEKKSVDGRWIEVLEAPDSRIAREFLKVRRLRRPGYEVRVITPREGTWSLNDAGLHLDKLLPFQVHPRLAKTTGRIIGTPHPVSLAAAQSGETDNYVVEVECGHCSHAWPDAVRPSKPTLVRCPACGTSNRIEP